MHRLLALLVVAFPAPALALTAGQVMDKVGPSVWTVRTVGGGASQQGSALIIGPGRALASCQGIPNASVIQVFRQKEVHIVRLEHADRERDLCTLASSELKAPPVEVVRLAEVKPGQRVFAIANPEGVFLTLSEGQVSALRPAEARVPPIQTSASAPPGGTGGGLFDDEGRLVGILVARYSQNQVAALAADWIAEIPARAAAAPAPVRGEAPRPGPAPWAPVGIPASPHLPAAGSMYVYRWTDRYRRGPQEFSVQVTDVAGWNVSENFRSRSQRATSTVVDARAPAFIGRLLDGGFSMLELAPYLPADSPPELRSAALNYPGTESAAVGPWTIDINYGGWEQVTVPAGSYKAMRVNVRGTRPRFGMIALNALRFEYTVWYAPEARRYVKFVHQSWNSVGPVSDAWGELLVYRPN